MAYRVAKISPSSLSAAEICPRFRPDGKENDAAAEGTMLHECLEDMVKQPKDQWDGWISTRDMSAEHKGLLEEASYQLKQKLSGLDLPVFEDYRLKLRNGKPRKAPLKAGLYPECEIERGQGRHGYIDLMIVKPDGMVTIIDYKMVRQEGHDYSLQLGAYACDINRLCPAHVDFEASIIAPRLKGDDVETHLWGAEHLEKIRNRIAEIEARADQSANDESIAGCPNDACQYCHWNGRCKYQAQTAVAVSHTMDIVSEILKDTPFENEILTRETFMNPANETQRGMRRLFIKFFTAVIDQWKEDDKAWNQQNPNGEIPGWKIGWRKGRATLDKDRMSEVRDALMSKLGMDQQGVMDVSDVSSTKLKEYLVANMGFSEKVAAQKMQEALDSLMTVGGAYTVWTQIKAKGKTKAIDADL